MEQEILDELKRRLEVIFPVADVRVYGSHVGVDSVEVITIREMRKSYGFRSNSAGRFRFSWPAVTDSYNEGGSKQTRGNKAKGFTQPYDEVIEAAVASYNARCEKEVLRKAAAANDEGVKLFTPEWSEVTTWDGVEHRSWGKVNGHWVHTRSTPTHYGVQFGSNSYWITDTDLASLKMRVEKIADLLDQIKAVQYNR